jgi:2-phospho-L-lactate guanylyltransferase (CobY/MobA/RfbA family)
MSIPGDNPILHARDDVLGRGPIAKSFARQVLALDVSLGAVVGVLGKWGSGKTSFVNMARDDFRSAGSPVLDFNPWMFSGAEQLVESFFVELAAQLKLRPGLAEIGNDLADYGEAFAGMGWLPVVGPWIERGRGAAKVLGKYLRRRQEGTQESRKKLNDALAAIELPIIVVLDDIDRLSTNEIRDVFKLVRLTASFPNIVYVVAFDRERVEQALAEEGVPGRDYLEKILQVAIDLPAVPEQILSRQIFAALDAVIADAKNPGELDQGVWPDVFMEVIRPLVRNMRDVRRYQVAVRGTLDELEDRIALADLLAMEAVRVFLPDVFREIQLSVDALCTPSERMAGAGLREAGQLKEAIEKMVETGKDHEEVVRQLINRLFPFAERHIGGSYYSAEWLGRFLRDRRIAHESILRLYLERVAGEQLENFYDAENAWHRMDDKEGFEQYLRSLDPERQEDVIRALETYEDEYRPEHVVPGTIVLWNLVAELPDKPRGMFDFDARLTVGRVTYRLLRSLPNQDAIEKAVEEVLPQLATLSAKREVIFDVGYHEGAGHKLVSEEAAKRIEASWRAEVCVAAADALAREYDLVRVIYWSRQGLEDGEPITEMPDDPTVTLAALQSARTETRSQGMGTRAVRRTAVFAWSLIDIYEDENTLIARIEALKSSEVEIPNDLAQLVEKYLGGWRPKDFDDPETEDEEDVTA